MLQPMHFVDERPLSHAVAIDFRETLTQELHSLYLLSLLLTADNDKADRCLVSAIGECGEGIGVFMEWADSLSFTSRDGSAASPVNHPFATIVALGAFERFVFVMSILEGQSEQDCAILLRCSRRDVMIARVLALTRLANTGADELMQA